MGYTDLKGSGHFTPGYGSCTMALEVEVDPETGKVKLLNSVAACDNGQVINPAMMEGQMEGGALSHYGQAFFEESLVDEKGRPINADFVSYFMPTAMEIPNFKLESIINFNPYGPFGAKGGGESFTTSAVAAAANAISNAIGVRMVNLPVTPDKILKALEKSRKK